MTQGEPIGLTTWRRLTRPLIGQTCSRAWIGIGACVTLEFGQLIPSTLPDRRPKGEFILWTWSAGWRLEQSAVTIVGNYDDDEVLASVEILIGLSVSRVHLAAGQLDLTIDFESGHTLRTFRRSAQADHWTLFVPGHSLFVSEDGTTILSEPR